MSDGSLFQAIYPETLHLLMTSSGHPSAVNCLWLLLTLWTPGTFLPNSCRRRHYFSHTTSRHQPNFRKTFPGARRFFGSEKRRDPSRAFIPLTK